MRSFEQRDTRSRTADRSISSPLYSGERARVRGLISIESERHWPPFLPLTPTLSPRVPRERGPELRLALCCFLLCLLCVTTSHAQNSGNGEEYTYDGFTEPAEDVMVSAIEIGRLESMLVKIGDRVEAGQLLARLEDSLQIISVEIAKQQAEMKGEYDAAVAEHRLHLNRTEQLRALAAIGTARPDELARAETDLQVAAARLLITQEELIARTLELKRQEVQLERRRIVSPLSGVVARVLRRPGEYVSPGDAAIVRVITKDSLMAVFNLPAADALHLRLGQVIPLRPRTIPRVVDGVVESIAPAIDGESGTVAVRLRIDNRDEILFPGDRCVMANVRQLAQLKQDKPGPRTLGSMTR